MIGLAFELIELVIKLAFWSVVILIRITVMVIQVVLMMIVFLVLGTQKTYRAIKNRPKTKEIT